MIAGPVTPASIPPVEQPTGRGFWRRPTTQLGWWAFALSAVFYGLLLIFIIAAAFFQNALEGASPDSTVATVLSFFPLMLLLGLGSGILALIAIFRRDRSWPVWLAFFPAVLVIALFIGDLLLALIAPE